MLNTDNLKKRLLFVSWAVPLSWLILSSDYTFPFIAMVPAQLLVLFLVFAASLEYNKLLAQLFGRNCFCVALVWLAYQYASFFFPCIAIRSSLDVYVLMVLVAAEAAFAGSGTPRWKRASLLFSGTMFLYISGASVLSMYHPLEPFQTMFTHSEKYHGVFSQMGILFLLFSIFLCDTAAYFYGSMFGKHRFTKTSPNKTIEGSVAGFLTSVIVSTIGWHFFALPRYSIFCGIFMGILIGIFAQAGDLLMSAMKRYFQVKDTSNIIPGHGGILDRFDSFFFTAPIVWLYLQIVQKIYG